MQKASTLLARPIRTKGLACAGSSFGESVDPVREIGGDARIFPRYAHCGQHSTGHHILDCALRFESALHARKVTGCIGGFFIGIRPTLVSMQALSMQGAKRRLVVLSVQSGRLTTDILLR